MPGQVTGAQINGVIRLVRDMTPVGDEQLSILARAFVTACRSCGADPTIAKEQIDRLFAENLELQPLD